MNIRQCICMLLMACLLVAAAPGVAVAAPSFYECGFYVVQPGDNLFRISLRFNVTMDAIMLANGITNPNYVYVGQSLCIPSGPVTPPATPPPAPPPPAPVSGNKYCVKAGDTLSAIAVRFGVTLYALMQANRIVNANYIYVGQCLVIPSGACCQPTPPSTSGKWKGEYYNTANLSGSPTLTRYDSTVNFDWGAGSPSAKIPADNFSVRWSRTIYLKAGAYRFTTTVDDGARLWVNDQLLIDQWGQHTGATFTKDVDLGAGYHAFRMEYQELTGNAMASLSWVRVADGGSAGAGGLTESGAWLGQYYSNKDLGGSPIVQRYDPWIEFNWGSGSPAPGVMEDNFFSARWTRNVKFEAGTYRFYAWVDDGVRLYVDNMLVIDQWRDSNGITFFHEATLTAGVHEVKVEYYEYGHDALITVWWEKLK